MVIVDAFGPSFDAVAQADQYCSNQNAQLIKDGSDESDVCIVLPYVSFTGTSYTSVSVDGCALNRNESSFYFKKNASDCSATLSKSLSEETIFVTRKVNSLFGIDWLWPDEYIVNTQFPFTNG